MKTHKFANLFPLIEGEEFNTLVEDIKKNGLINPIITYDNQILDGRNRYNACDIAHIEPNFKEYKGNDPLGFVLSLNLARRHLNESQRAMVGAKIANIKNGENQFRVGNISDPLSQSNAAKQLSISDRSIRTAKKVQELGSTDLIAAVERGKIDITNANKILDLSKSEQDKCVAKILNGEKTAKVVSQIQFNQRSKRLIEQSKGNKELKTDQKYPILYVDPPWQYDFSTDNSDKIENHYPTMDLQAICDLPISRVSTNDCILFLWATSPKLNDAMQVIKAWGFEYKTCAVWDKEWISMGFYFRQQHELLLVAKKGNPPAPLAESRPPSVIREKRKEHSAKPEVFYHLIEQMYPDLPKLEMFARQKRKGWASWGNEAT